jgi:NAD(P)H-dependent flavin oxidoreductase YrpB (nitropropane dioxygenase family)
MPAKYVGKGGGAEASIDNLHAMIPAEHQKFVEELLAEHGVPPLPEDLDTGVVKAAGLGVDEEGPGQVEVALSHPVSMVVNALGPPPPYVVEAAHERGILVGGLVGNRQHAERQVAQGTDVIVAQGTEAGGHCGDVSTMVLVPEVVDAVAPVPVLAAGGIGSGRQIAAGLALGAQGVWLGSLWLTTAEGGSSPAVLQSYLDATSADTVRSRCYTGKPARMVRNAWTDAWLPENGPGALGMPLQNILTSEANARIMRSGRTDLAFAPVGQIVGRMNDVRPVRDVMFQLVEEYIETIERLEEGTRS